MNWYELLHRLPLIVAQIALLLILPPFLLGVINRVKAKFAGRKGPPLFQLYYDLAKLLRKGTVLSTTTTWVFLLGPVAGVATAVLAGLFIPLGGLPSILSFHGDLLLVAYLLALGRFCTILSALDTGSAFEGMGASREAAFSCLVEPALFLGLVALAQLNKEHPLTMSNLLGASSQGWHLAAGAMILVLVAWFLVMLVENCRIPFDDPNTHLELTMIHEVMVLDHSGPPLGFILYGAAVKLFIFGSLILGLVVPHPENPHHDLAISIYNLAIAIVGLILIAMVIGVVESVMARLRLVRVPLLLVAASLLSGFGVVLLAMR